MASVKTTKPGSRRSRRAIALAGMVVLSAVAACDDGFVQPDPPLHQAEQQAASAFYQRLNREALVALYDSTSGANWKRNDNWLSDAPVGEWYGIATDTEGRVVRITLRDNALEGEIPAEIGDLADLRSLRLDHNQLSGPIPTTVGSLEHLAALWLGDNQLTGTLPTEFAELDSLSGLWIGNNRLTGVVPTGLRDLPLQFFEFAGNEGLCVPATEEFVSWSAGLLSFAGPLCSEVDIAALRILYETTDGENWTSSEGWLGDGLLSDWFGVETDAIGRVSELVLSSNGLSGNLPRELGDLQGLTRLDVGGNELWGPLPQSLTVLSLEELRYANTELCVPDDDSFREWLTAITTHDGTSMQCPPLSQRDILEAFYEGTGGPGWNRSDNWLTDAPLGEWYGVETDESDNVLGLYLSGNVLVGRIPAELAGLTDLGDLELSHNYLLEGPIPTGLFNLTSLRTLGLTRVGVGGPLPSAIGRLSSLQSLRMESSRITGPIPPELGRLTNLRSLALGYNYLTGPIPPSLGNLSKLVRLELGVNKLTGEIPAELGRLTALTRLNLWRNHLTGEIPAELGDLSSLGSLLLEQNQLTGPIPAELGDLVNLDYLNLATNGLTGAIPTTLNALGDLSAMYLQENALEGAIPEGIGDLANLRHLWVGNNAGLSGAVPTGLTGLSSLESLKAGGTDLCAPQDAEFLTWLSSVPFHRLARCDIATAYLTQAVQSREFPVPLVAGRPALLRVFVASEQATTAGLPAVRATFYVDDAQVHVAEIAAQTGTIPTEVDEGDLTRSANTDIPEEVIRPGLEMVIEIDPDGTLDASLGIPQRIPATGRMGVDVVDVPDFQLTLIPFLYEPDPDSAILKITAGMASDPEGHEMLAETGMFLPIGGWDVELHDPVVTSTDNGFLIRNETEMIRLVEGRPGYWLAMTTPVRDSGLFGVAYGIGSWTSFSKPISWVVAHELGHNLGLFHAPCGGAGGPDRLYPHAYGVIGSWGYDRESRRLISPYTPDLMSYCGGQWIGDYHLANALRHRVSAETAADYAPMTRSVLVWGGLDSDGNPYLEPSFITDAMSSLPPPGRDFVVRGTTEDGSEAFAFTFDMPETWDVDDERSGFVFAIPVTWPGALERVSLTGGEESAILDGSTDSPMTILRDPVTGEVRAILRRPVAQAMEAVGEPNLEVLFSAGIPDEVLQRR